MEILKKKDLEFHLLGITLIICFLGILNLYSLSSGSGESSYLFYKRQILWFIFSIFSLGFVLFFDYRFFLRYAYPIYVGTIIMLIVVLVTGENIMGSQRWLKLGPVSFQPSEMAKIATLFLLARFFYNRPRPQGYNFLDLTIPLAITLLPSVLIFLEPDLGTAGIIILTFLSVFFLIKVETKTLFIFFVSLLIILPLSWFILKDYQRMRIISLLYSSSDPLGAGYQSMQSLISIGSGGLLGKGFMKGTQGRYLFLPNQNTDFVFAAFAEEFGFLVTLILIILYLLLVAAGLKIALSAKDRFGMFLAGGISLLFFWQIIINIAMNVRLFPLVGIALPLMSYGGSSMLMSLFSVGLLLNIGRRRFILRDS